MLTTRHAEALLQVPDPTLLDQRTRLVELETKSRLPAMHTSVEYVDAGTNRTELFRRTATMWIKS
jgi:hypothetical protein